ncbi:MAG: membrane dipeptidase [Pseudomonadales bacterium]|nr:membrane dipeptidase [Pseudomonadales bacterium]
MNTILCIRKTLLTATCLLVASMLSACSPPPESTEQVQPQATTDTSESQDITVVDLVSQAQAIHDRVLVLDAHADIVPPGTTSRYGDADGSSQVAPNKMATGGVDAVVLAVAVGSGPRTPAGDAEARAIADVELAGVMAIADADDRVVVVRSADELEQAHANGEIALLLGFQNARILQGSVDALNEFYDAGVRVFALTHLGHNDFADSSRPVYIAESGGYEPTEEHGGLSALGKAAIARINELGAVVDVSQLSKPATLQAIELSQTPVIASHSNVRALSDVARNLSDEEIDLIGATGGVIHIAAFTAYLLDISEPQLIENIKAIRREAGIDERYSYPYELYWEIDNPEEQTAFLTAMRDLLGPTTVSRMVDHIDYLVERIGIDHVGIGNDFNHGGGIADFRNAEDALNMTLGLLERGYSAEDIEKIWSGNFIRVMRVAEAN